MESAVSLKDQSTSVTDKFFPVSGTVFDIQKFSIHDGPGIRDLIFLKGCPLTCKWCSNPESQLPQPQLLFKQNECLGSDACGLCLDICPAGAIKTTDTTSILVDHSTCKQCLECVAICPTNALETAGKSMTVDELLDVVERDGGFHHRSGGGITVSGGEPLTQATFVSALFQECRKRLIHTAVETTGFGRWEQFYTTVEFANVVLYDIKSMNSSKHKEYTGVPNDLILQNLKQLSYSKPQLPIIIRTPVIPGFNDSEKDITEIVTFIKTLPSVTDYQLLPFHRLGLSKYDSLGKTCDYNNTPNIDESLMEHLKNIAARFKM